MFKHSCFSFHMRGFYYHPHHDTRCPEHDCHVIAFCGDHAVLRVMGALVSEGIDAFPCPRLGLVDVPARRLAVAVDPYHTVSLN